MVGAGIISVGMNGTIVRPRFSGLKLMDTSVNDEFGYSTTYRVTVEVDGEHLDKFEPLMAFTRSPKGVPATLEIAASETMGGVTAEVHDEKQGWGASSRFDLANEAGYARARNTVDLLHELKSRIERDTILKTDQPVLKNYFQGLMEHLDKMIRLLETVKDNLSPQELFPDEPGSQS